MHGMGAPRQARATVFSAAAAAQGGPYLTPGASFAADTQGRAPEDTAALFDTRDFSPPGGCRGPLDAAASLGHCSLRRGL
jgi:hypothetical protein